MYPSKLRNTFPEWMTFLKFCVVGVVGTAIDVGSLYVLRDVIGINLLVATTLAFCLAVVNNFFFNKFWTFKKHSSAERKAGIRKQFIKFLIVSIGGLIMTLILMSIFVYGFHIWHIVAKLITSVFVLLWNFLVNKNWTFRERVNEIADKEHFEYELSIVIPMYNEQGRILKTLTEIIEFCKHYLPSSEIILVDDGSKDATVNTLAEYSSKEIPLRILTNEINHGKGYVVRQGMLAARGKYIVFTDADNSTPITEIQKVLAELQINEVVIGSRYIRGSNILVEQPTHRIKVSRFGNKLIQFFLLEGIYDTQCGFKGFQHTAAQQIFSRLKTNRFGFDMEALVIARLLNYQIKEIPVRWIDSPQSRVRPIRDTLITLAELFYIKLNILSGRYE